MAEAVASSAVGAEGGLRFFSAGMGAAAGAPMTIEAIEALRRLGVQAPAHRSIGVTAEMVTGADFVFVMTRGHLARLLEMAPGAKGKVFLLDPEGRDIPDPIGGPQSIYDETARMIQSAVKARLGEILA